MGSRSGCGRAHRSSGIVAVLAALLAGVVALPATPAAAGSFADETIEIIKDDEFPSNAEIAVRLSEATPVGTAGRVLISRDDQFADALASGYLQTDAPLLMVPKDGPVPPRVLTEIARLGASDAVILGGEAAVSPGVAAELTAAGLDVERRSGPSRFETAAEVARLDASAATTAIVARAFPTNPADPTQGFADALAAGGMAARERYPVLLSESGVLTATTREYLASSSIEHVILVGGTAALSPEVEAEIRDVVGSVERLAGATRFETAVEIADKLGDGDAADVGRVVLVNGTGIDAWAGGFAAANHAATLDAPILLVDDVRVPPATAAFLEQGQRFAQDGDVGVTCVVHPLACEQGRQALGLPTYPLLDLDPPRNSTVQPGQTITATLGPDVEGAGVELVLKGSCVGGERAVVTDATGTATFDLANDIAGSCLLDVAILPPSGPAPGPGGEPSEPSDGVLTLGVAYLVGGEPVRAPGDVLIASDVVQFGDVAPVQPVYVNDRWSCTAPGGATATSADWALQGRYRYPDGATDTVALGSRPVLTTPEASCTVEADAPPEAERVLWGLYSWSDAGLRRPLLLGSGTSASFDLGAIPGVPNDLALVWLVEVNVPNPSVPQPQPPGEPGFLDVRADVDLVCGGQAVPQGENLIAPGTSCTARSPYADLLVWVLQPGTPHQVAPEVAFTIPDEVRGTTVTVLVDPDALTGGGDCTTAEPLDAGFLASSNLTSTQPVRTYALFLLAGESVRIRLDALITGAEEDLVDPLVRLYGPDGGLLGEDDDGGEYLNSLLEVTASEEGTYCLEATSFGGSTGSYLLTADLAPFLVDAGVVDATRPEVVYEGIELFDGELFVAEMRAPDGELTDPILALYGPDGTQVAYSDDEGGFPNARIQYGVTADGAYTLVATVYETSYGAYDLAASAVFYGPGAFAEARADVRSASGAGDARGVRSGGLRG